MNCRKYCVQSPTRKEGWDLFWGTSDDNSVRIFTPINIHEDESKAPMVKENVVEQRYSKDYKNHDMT